MTAQERLGTSFCKPFQPCQPEIPGVVEEG